MNGIVIINKPSGISSFDVIKKLRKILNEKKIGHTGTLDPLASGVLIVCLGKATRLAQDIESLSKTYIAGFTLGYSTDTYDIEGKIVNENNDLHVDSSQIKDVLSLFLGKTKQMPPMYSAIKKNGVRLYELARKGIEVEREARDIQIDAIELLEYNNNNCKIRCQVSKGTYIRSLINDIGIKLGTYATMTSLLRESIGTINIKDSYTIEDVEQLSNNNNTKFLIDPKDFFQYDSITIDNERMLNLFKNGNMIPFNQKDGLYKIYTNSKFIGFGKVTNNFIKGYKYF